MLSLTFEDPDSPPVFIISCERSGSTLLRQMLDTHSKICSPGELGLGLLASTLLTAISRTLDLVATSGSLGKIETSREAIARRLISSFMNEYARRKGKTIWCDKTPLNTMYLAELHKVFPDARYVCLYRNCLDVVDSCLEVSKTGFMAELASYAGGNPRNLVTAMIDSWIDKTTRILLFESLHSAQCMRVKYESLVKTPTPILSGIFAFLGVKNQDILPELFSIPHDQGGGDPKISRTNRIHTNSIDRGVEIPPSLIERSRLPALNALLDELGYPRVVANKIP